MSGLYSRAIGITTVLKAARYSASPIGGSRFEANATFTLNPVPLSVPHSSGAPVNNHGTLYFKKCLLMTVKLNNKLVYSHHKPLWVSGTTSQATESYFIPVVVVLITHSNNNEGTMKNSILHEIFCKSLFHTSRPIVKQEF